MSVPVPVSLSIFDIALIVDIVCHSLSLYDIQNCRRVSKQWSVLFKPHLWSTTKLPSTTASHFNDTHLSKDTIATLFANRRWIQSLHLNTKHLKHISESGIFTTLQEIVLYDDADTRYGRNRPFTPQAAAALIHTNTHLQRLTIDIDYEHYNRGDGLVQAIMLAVARHPSLTQFFWQVPNGYENTAFAKCLLYACHGGSIQELVVAHRYYNGLYDNVYFGCCCSYYNNSYLCKPFKQNDDTVPPDLKNDPQYVELFKNKLEVPIDQLEEPFAFRRLCLPPGAAFEPYLLPLLCACPDLQYTSVDMSSDHSGTILEMLASRPHPLRGLGLDCAHSDMDYSREIGRFKQLQRLHIPAMSSDQVGRIIDVLATSGGRFESLEVLGVSMTAVSAKDVVSIVATFPNLKELRVESVRIYTQGGRGGTLDHQEQPLKDKELDSMDTVVQDWDPEEIDRQGGDMVDWWRYWSQALRFMKAVRAEHYCYQQDLTANSSFFCQSQKRSFSMRFMFMYPVRAFMSYSELFEYAQATGPRAKHARGFTIMDAYRLARGILDNEFKANAFDAECMDYMYYMYWYDARWNEYDQREEERWGIPDAAQEYTIAKSRNRHRSLRDRKRSAFRRPFKK
ncbi:hypothetical protein BG006_003387 [Podila minutissima]|uniref:F-box domain-containing protein n=1 Tax=Podila minutissima TaxID=64525 RepID=A0A9P5VMX5_9FUNG|nr:hypothetical protein BG006_003387 [Podila minutissima]